MDLDFLFDKFSSFPIEDLMQSLGTKVSIIGISKLFLVFMVISLGAGIFSRLIFGPNSSLSRAISASVCILFIYVVTVIVYILKPWSLDRLLSPLPYVSFCGEALVIHPFVGVSFQVFASEALSLIVLSFLVINSCSIIHSDSSPIRWAISSFVAVTLSMLLHLLANWAIKTFIPSVYTQYGTMLFFILLLLALFGGIAKIILGIFLTSVNPVFGILYTFFFSSKLGKAVSLSVLSAAIVTIVFSIIEYLGYSVIFISAADLLSYIPLLIALIILWYLIGKEL